MPKRVITIFFILIVLAGVTIGLLRRKEKVKSPAPVSASAPLAPIPAMPVTVVPTVPAKVAPESVKPASTKTTSTSPASYAHEVKIGPQILYVDISTTPEQMQEGLSDRPSMAEDQGMLFNFVTPQMPEFWMNDMNFPLDFLWINSGKIVGVTADAPAAPRNADGSFDDSNLPLYPPPSPVDEVMEVNAGWAQKNSITAGDAVSE